MLDTEQIQYHIGMKKANPSYPSLPKCFRPEQIREEKSKYKRLMSQPQTNSQGGGDYLHSVTRGFILRVHNWERDMVKKSPQLSGLKFF